MKFSRSVSLPTLLCALLWLGALLPATAAGQSNALVRIQNARRIVFVGDSITHNGQYVAAIETYFITRFPEQALEFINVGLSSETVSGLSEDGHAGGRHPRPGLGQRLDSILRKTKPDLIFACYGMNDGIYHPYAEERFREFQRGMESLHQAAEKAGARIIHVTPPVFDPLPIAKNTTNAPPFSFRRPHPAYNEVLDRYSEWMLALRTQGWDVVDLHGAMNRWLAQERRSNPDFVCAGDGVHPDARGHWFIAKQILLHLGAADVAAAHSTSAMLAAHPQGTKLFRLVQDKQELLRDAWLSEIGHTRPGVKAGLPLPEAQAKAAELEKQIRELARADASAPDFPGKKSAWQGFDRYDFEFQGKPAIVVVPKQPLPGRPWAWRGEFFGAFAKADAALVGKGFHLAYLRVPNLFGSPEAVSHWNAFHAELTGKHGLAMKPALIGLSRGGLYCYNWAIANPNKVACIYADAPVCDFKSWPGGRLKNLGKGDGSAAEWAKLLKAYRFQSDADATAYRGNPVDQLKPLTDAKVPLLHVYGDADTVVPWEENTGVIAERYRHLGGSITLIPKPGVGHHPHGLDDPTPIVDFILKHATPPVGQN